MTKELIIKLAKYLQVLKKNSGNRRLSQNDKSRITEIITSEIEHYIIHNLSELKDEDIEALGYTRKGIKNRFGVAG